MNKYEKIRGQKNKFQVWYEAKKKEKIRKQLEAKLPKDYFSNKNERVSEHV